MVDGQTKHYAYYINTITISIKKYTAKFYNNVSIHSSFLFPLYPQAIFFMWIYFNMKQFPVVGDSLSIGYKFSFCFTLWLFMVEFFFLIIFDKLVINNKQLSYVKYIYIRKNTTNKMKKLKNTNDILFVSIKQNFLS
jgi:hypothetical protein